MPFSMTGYGRAEKEADGRRVVIEARSVNHRFMDINVKMTGKDWRMADLARKVIKGRFARGSFDVSVFVSSEAAGCRVSVDDALLEGYMAVSRRLANKYGVKYPPSMGDLFQIKELFTVCDPECSEEEAWPLVEETLNLALDQLETMRRDEGGNTLEDLQGRLSIIGQLVERISRESDDSADRRLAKLKSRIHELVEELDEDRVAQEVAILADRSDISEEIARLKSHLKQADAIMDDQAPVGRKLEFLTQEINREVNTIGSKTASSSITNIVVDIKSELEKIREQAQNLE